MIRIKDIDDYEDTHIIFVKGTPLCSCCNKAPATIPPEPCPYSEELGDYKSEEEILCDCCEYCRHECAMDI
jgi:hypothetical protein